jgi:DNA-directed RNA polymerase specialized sigma subunit
MNQALGRLESRLGKVVELRFFFVLSQMETAAVLEVSERTVKRVWRKARAFLFRELAGETGPDPQASRSPAET